MDNDGWTRKRHVCMGRSTRADVRWCMCACVCSHPLRYAPSQLLQLIVGGVITISLISYPRLTLPPPAATAPSLHIYHIHLIFRNKCSRKRIMHLLYAPFITDTFTWGFAFMVSNGALFTGVPHICWDGVVVGGGSALFTLALSVSGDKWVDLSISAVTFIKEIWPSSREPSAEL